MEEEYFDPDEWQKKVMDALDAVERNRDLLKELSSLKYGTIKKVTSYVPKFLKGVDVSLTEEWFCSLCSTGLKVDRHSPTYIVDHYKMKHTDEYAYFLLRI